MDRVLGVVALCGLGILFIAYLLMPAESLVGTIPPTKAFTKIITDNGEINARGYNDYIDMRTDDSVNVEMDGNRLYMWSDGNSTETNSFGTIIMNGVSYKATMPNQTITINTQGSISGALSGGVITIKLNAISCGLLQGIKGVDASGNLFCAAI